MTRLVDAMEGMYSAASAKAHRWKSSAERDLRMNPPALAVQDRRAGSRRERGMERGAPERLASRDEDVFGLMEPFDRLVTELFRLDSRGWFRRQIIGVVRQASGVSLGGWSPKQVVHPMG